MNFHNQLLKSFPSLSLISNLDSQLKFVASQKHLKLPKAVLPRMQKSVANIYKYAHSDGHLSQLRKSATAHELKILESPAPQKSVLSAFDFHYDETTDQLSLIEINTNASAYLIASQLYKGKGEEALMKSFDSDAELFGLKKDYPLLIVDEEIPQQKMYMEFLMYQDLFRSRGHQAEIRDFKAVTASDKGAFIYNRHTDFLFERPESKNLLSHFTERTALVSPSPKEYLIMAAKDRLSGFAENKVDEALIPSKSFQSFSGPDEIWENRKNYYFKPRRMFGGKAVFRGSSISRKRFEELNPAEYLAQEARAPGVVGDWKFDLRAYTYEFEIQLVVARMFQGQLLNFSTEGGGLATVEFADIEKIAVEKS